MVHQVRYLTELIFSWVFFYLFCLTLLSFFILYDINKLISAVSEETEAWRNRRLKPLYVFTYADCLYVPIKDELTSDVVDVQRGMNVVIDSLSEPLYQIAENAGYSGKNIVEQQLKEKENFGFNAKTGEWVDMFKEGIVDPTMVTRSAVLNAASIAGLFLTTEAAVGTIKEKEQTNNGDTMY